jgi:hypothetical protein
MIKGIYRELEHSPYFTKINNIVFYFSSKLYLNKFNTVYESEIIKMNERTSHIYKDVFNLDVTVLSLIRLYASIEKRGFYIELGAEKCQKISNLQFELQLKINS